jgi:hypothetical protein
MHPADDDLDAPCPELVGDLYARRAVNDSTVIPTRSVGSS